MMTTLKHAALAALMLAAAAGCSRDGSDGDDLARLRVLHASRDTPAVDVYVQGETRPRVRDLAYGALSGDIRLDASDYIIEVRPAGADASTPATVISDAIKVSRAQRLTVVAGGSFASTSADTRLRLFPVYELFSQNPSAIPGGQAETLVVHAAVDAPTVDVDFGDDGVAEIEDLERFTATTVPTQIPSGPLVPVSLLAGDPSAKVSAFSIESVPNRGQILWVVVGTSDLTAPESERLTFLGLGPNGVVATVKQNPFVYPVHAVPDGGPIDFLVDGEVAGGELCFFGHVADVVQLPMGPSELSFRTTKDGAGPTDGSVQILEAGKVYLGLATGFVDEANGEPLSLFLYEEGFERDPLNARVRWIHGAPDVATVDLSTVTGGQLDTPLLVENISFGESTELAGQSLPEGFYLVGAAPTGSIDPVATFDGMATADLRLFVAAAGSLDGNGFGIRLFMIITNTTPWVMIPLLPN